MSLENATKKQIRHFENGWHCPYCGTRYYDRKEAEECKRNCRRNFVERNGKR